MGVYYNNKTNQIVLISFSLYGISVTHSVDMKMKSLAAKIEKYGIKKLGLTYIGEL